jgi:UDP-glucose 4-epimerase
VKGTALLTGASGRVGRAATRRIEAERWDVRPFDLLTGGDLRDEAAVFEAVEGCDAIVHAGAIADDDGGTPAEIVVTNVLGTWHVLLAAERHAVSRVVYFSSAQVFGFSNGEGVPAYRPVDDDHPLRGARPYGMSKRLAEEMCAAWTARTGIPTIVLRPVLILTDEGLERRAAQGVDPGAFVHLDDVADAVVRALCADVDAHVRLTLCGPGDFDVSKAERVLGWRATRQELAEDWPAFPGVPLPSPRGRA